MGEPSNAAAPRRSRVLGALMLAAVFALGMVSGASLFYAGQRSIARGGFPARGEPGLPGLSGREPLERFERAVDLSPEQREQFRAVMRETREEMRAVVDRSRERLRETLTPEQQEKFEALRPRERRGPRDSRRGRWP